MCRFKVLLFTPAKKLTEFKYIQCVGSRELREKEAKLEANLNTSNVSVQDTDHFLLYICLTYLNTSNVSVQDELLRKSNKTDPNLNTSNVSVQVRVHSFVHLKILYLNTSNVSVQGLHLFLYLQ